MKNCAIGCKYLNVAITGVQMLTKGLKIQMVTLKAEVLAEASPKKVFRVLSISMDR